MSQSEHQTRNSLKDTLATAAGVLGFFVTLVAFILNLQQWVQAPSTLRAASLAGFILFFLGSLWFAFKAKNVGSTWRWLSLIILYIFSVLYALWLGTWLSMSGSFPLPIPDSSLPIASQVASVAWNSLNDKDYGLSLSLAEACVATFENEALQIQQQVIAAGKPLPKTGGVSESEKSEIFSRGVINEVASCYFVEGQSLERLNRVSEAKVAYGKIQRFPHARVWDPNGWFWSPAESAIQRLAILQ